MKDPISFCINTAVNELEYLKLLLKSLQENLKYDHHEVVVFIDSDNQKTFEWLLTQKANFKDLKILRNILPVCYGPIRNINEMFKFASHEIVSYLQSDMIVCRNYDEYLLKHVKPNTILSSTRIEPPLHGPGPEKHTMSFGLTPSEFDYDGFLDYCDLCREDKITSYYFAPFTLYKEVWNSIGGQDNTFRRSRDDSDILNRFILSGVEITQTWEALVYHFTCTSSRGQGWYEPGNNKAQEKVQLQAKADEVELTRIFRKWGEFSHGHPTTYYYNITSEINIDVDSLGLYKNVEMFFTKNYITSKKIYNEFVSQNEHLYANILYRYSEEQWEDYKYLCNIEKLEDRVSLGKAEGDVVISFKLSSVTQDTFDNLISKLQHVVHTTDIGTYEFEGFVISINKKENTIKNKLRVNNPEIKPEHLYEVY
jgi:hypothetical protein